MDATAIMQLAMALLPLVENGVSSFIAWIDSMKSAAQQAGEWTPTQEAAYRAALFAKTQDPAYQPDGA
jgi:hypothetical protein